MNNRSKALLLILLCLSCVCSLALPCTAREDTERAGQMARDITAYNLSSSQCTSVQGFIDSFLSQGGSESCEWYALTLARYEKSIDFSQYVKALKDKIDKAENTGAVTRLKYALTLLACGDRSDPYITEALDKAAGSQGIMSYVFALHLMNNGVKHSTMSSADIVDTLISMQTEQGGWALTPNSNDPDVSAMVLQAISPFCTKGSAALSSAR